MDESAAEPKANCYIETPSTVEQLLHYMLSAWFMWFEKQHKRCLHAESWCKLTGLLGFYLEQVELQQAADTSSIQLG